MRGLAILALLHATAASAAAPQAWLFGTWCENDGERMLVDAAGLGFNEHTICAWEPGRFTATAVDAKIRCANVYVNGGRTVRTDRHVKRFRVTRRDADKIDVVIDDRAAEHFVRCEN